MSIKIFLSSMLACAVVLADSVYRIYFGYYKTLPYSILEIACLLALIVSYGINILRLLKEKHKHGRMN